MLLLGFGSSCGADSRLAVVGGMVADVAAVAAVGGMVADVAAVAAVGGMVADVTAVAAGAVVEDAGPTSGAGVAIVAAGF